MRQKLGQEHLNIYVEIKTTTPNQLIHVRTPKRLIIFQQSSKKNLQLFAHTLVQLNFNKRSKKIHDQIFIYEYSV